MNETVPPPAAVQQPVAEKKPSPDAAAQKPAPDVKTPAHPAPQADEPHHRLAQMRHDPVAIRRVFESGEYPYAQHMRAGPYEEHMLKLQQELLKAQRWVEETGEKIVILFEGRDAAGKGGTIKRFMEHMNPRTARVVALQKPTERERTQWYFQRYISQLPAGGEICLFDRSWYNRAGVERVMGFCTPTEYLEFMRQCPEVERMLARSGIRLFKYWFSVSREEQRRRFEARKDDPLKQWKLSPIDLRLAGQVGRLYRGQGSDVLLYRHGRRALDHRQVGRQEAGAAQLHDAISCASLPYPNKDHVHRPRPGPADRRLHRTCDRPGHAHHRKDRASRVEAGVKHDRPRTRPV